MKKNKFIAFLTTVTVTIVAAFSATVAWFSTTIIFGDDTADVTGYSDGAYYDSGSGTEDDPYGIRTPRHLYNLAWLQYLGQYNKIESNKRVQFYFKLVGDVDMTGWTIPPIGTTTHPFIGEFNGNGFTISNATVSNSYADYERTPDIVNSVTGVDIVGLFGVVGSLDTSVTDDNKASVSMTDKYGSAPYDSRVNQIIDLGIENATISSQTNKTLIGIAAGYVNGTLDGVAVNDSNIAISNTTTQAYDSTNLTSNFSDYSLVGYATDNFIDVLEEKTIKVETPEAEYVSAADAGDNWGNSINMLNAYNRLLNEKNNVGSTFTVTYVSGSIYDTDGTTKISDTETTLTKHKLSSGFASEFTITQSVVNDSQSNQVASYTFYDRTIDAQSTGYDNYMYMFGKYDFSVNTTNVKLGNLTTPATNNSYLITDNDDNYLSFDGANPDNAYKEDLNSSSTFTYTSNRYLSYVENGTTYYLRVNNGTLTRTDSTNNASAWYYDSTNHLLYYDYSSWLSTTRYYLVCQNENWFVATEDDFASQGYYKISFRYNYTTYYISANGTTLSTTTNSNNALTFMRDAEEMYSTTINDTTYFFGAVQSGGAGTSDYVYTPGLYTANTNNLYYFSGTGNLTFSAKRRSNSRTNSTFYFYYNGSYTANRGNNTSCTFTEVEMPGSDDEYNGMHVYFQVLNNMAGGTYTYSSNPTYFPLGFKSNNVNDDGYNEIADNNTGYIVSGANYTNQPGDIRISKYAISNLSASCGNNSTSYSSTNFNVVTRTADTSDFVLIKDNYNRTSSTISSALSSEFGSTKYAFADLGLAKYSDSRDHLHDLLNGASNVFGLHFMDAQISASKKITIPFARINRNDFTDFELPEDCVDFNLKKKGIINFFAGTYYPDNTTFFSLHNIIRDSSGKNIVAIKEIKEIYKNTGLNAREYPYIYKYSDGSYNIAYGGSSDAVLGGLVFNMNWVTNPTIVQNACYYFEIPANAGEYCLGSVSGKDGAYLMYLDIGASTNSTDVTTVTERITTIVNTFEFVIGIDFVTNIPKTKDEFHTIDGGDSAHVSIATGATGTLNYTYNADAQDENKGILTLDKATGKTFTGTLASSYSSLGTTIQDQIHSTQIVPTVVETHTKILDKITSYEYNATTSTLVTTISERETNDGTVGNWRDVSSETEEDVEATYTSNVALTNVGDVIFEFEFSAPQSANVTIETFYHPETSAYYFTIKTNVAIIVHIKTLVETYNYTTESGTDMSVTYSFYINSEDTTVSQGDYIDIAASS